jgi:hypothetical protein
LLLLFEAAFTSVFKEEKSKRIHRIVESNAQIMTDPDPGGPKTYGSLYGSGSATLLLGISLVFGQKV